MLYRKNDEIPPLYLTTPDTCIVLHGSGAGLISTGTPPHFTKSNYTMFIPSVFIYIGLLHESDQSNLYFCKVQRCHGLISLICLIYNLNKAFSASQTVKKVIIQLVNQSAKQCARKPFNRMIKE